MQYIPKEKADGSRLRDLPTPELRAIFAVRSDDFLDKFRSYPEVPENMIGAAVPLIEIINAMVNNGNHHGQMAIHHNPDTLFLIVDQP